MAEDLGVLPAGSRPVRGLLQKSALLLVARAVQAAVGVLTFVLLTRHLNVGGFGEFATALAVATIAGGVLSASLSDAATVAHAELPLLRLLPGVSLAITVLLTGVALLIADGANLPLAVLGGGLYVTASLASAAPTAQARKAENARGLAGLNAAGSAATLIAVFSLVMSDVGSWGAYVLCYALQPAALLLLPRVPRSEDSRRPSAGALRADLRAARPYVVSQSSWLVLAQVNILVLRAVAGPAAVGRYAGMTRILDLLAVVGPLIGTFALPAFARLAKGGNGSGVHTSRLNLAIAATGAAVIVGGTQFGWLAWDLAYPTEAFPAVVFGVLAAGYGINAATGLPDRVLQGSGRAPLVSKAAIAATISLVALSAALAPGLGLLGAAVALVCAVGGVNVFMLAATRPDSTSLVGYGLLAALSTASAFAVGTGLVQDSFVGSSLLALGGVAAAGIAAYWTMNRLTLRSVVTA